MTSRYKALLLTAVLTLATLTLTGCSEVEEAAKDILKEIEAGGQTIPGQQSGSSDSSSPREAAGAPAAPSLAEAEEQLASLTIAPSGSMTGYSRELFPHWVSDGTEFGWDEPDGSCDVRDDALIRDGQSVQIDEDCSFVSGEWVGPYTGATLTDSSDVDIDHVVPLANAWRSGASEWSTADREVYANDPGVLLSTDDGANQEKGDKGPEAWKPPNEDYWCEYSKRWISIKSTWGLSVNEAEKTSLREMLGTCEAG